MITNAFFEEWNKDLVGLAWSFQVNPASCGKHEHFEEYIRLIAITDNLMGMAKTHALIDKDKNALIGYVSLKSTALTMKGEGGIIGEPALEIANLAVAQAYEGERAGTALVNFVIAKAVELNEHSLGIKYITLAADERAIGFYEKMGFEKMDKYWELPRENWNVECIPMFMNLKEGI